MEYEILVTSVDEYRQQLINGGVADYQVFLTVHSSIEIAEEITELLNNDQFRDCHFKVKQ